MDEQNVNEFNYYEVDCYFLGKFVKTVKMTKAKIEKMTKLGREYTVVNGRIVSEIPQYEEPLKIDSNPLNNPIYCAEHNL